MDNRSTKQRFFEVSVQLFKEKGYKGTTMRDIAQRINVEAPTIYNYVSSKQALLDRFVFEMAEKFSSGIHQIEASSYSPLEKVKAIIGLNVRLTIENPNKIALLVNEWKHLEEPRLNEFLANRSAYEAKISQIILTGMDEGSIRKMDVKLAVNAFLSSIRWLFSWYSIDRSSVNPFELEKQMTDFVLGGIKT